MQKILKISLAVIIGLTASTGFAQSHTKDMPPGPPPHLEKGPPLKDITRVEALARAAERFDAADTNKDGILSVSEMRAAHGPGPYDKRDREEHRGPPRGQDFPGSFQGHSKNPDESCCSKH